MLGPTLSSAFSVLALARFALAEGCSTHSFTSCADGIIHWYDPDTGQVCDPLDCGGGRAPPKTNVPGCAGYTGTEVPTTSYLSCWKPSTAEALTTEASATEALSSAAESTTEGVESTTEDVETTAHKDTKTEVETTETKTNTARSTTKPATSLSQETAASATEAAASTTPAATLSTQTPTAKSNTSGSSSTPNAGNLLGGSLVAAAGAALVGIVIV